MLFLTQKIKKLDEKSLQKLKEGTGPSDKCLCSLLSPPEDRGKGLRASIRKAFASFGSGKKGRKGFNQKSIEIPLSALSIAGGKLHTKKEVVRRKTSCGKCGCDNENIVLKHSVANIRITSPDASSFCTCPSNCLSGKELFKNNIKVTVENLRVYDVNSDDSTSSDECQETISLLEQNLEGDSISSRIYTQYLENS